jgi:hypothetical protein
VKTHFCGHPSVSSPPSLLSVSSPLFPIMKSNTHILTKCIVHLTQDPCFSPCRAYLGSGTGLPVWEGGKSANSFFFLSCLTLSLFCALFSLRFVTFLLLCTRECKSAKKLRRPPLILTLILLLRIANIFQPGEAIFASDPHPLLQSPPICPPPLPKEVSQWYSLLSPASYVERARELGQHRLAPLSIADYKLWEVRGRGGGRTGISRYNSTHSTWPGLPYDTAHANIPLAQPTMQKSSHQCFAQPGLPCGSSYIYPCWCCGGGGRRHGEKISTGRGHIFLTLSAATECIQTGQGQNYLLVLGHE